VIEPQILHGDARALPLPDASVGLIVTSPPYWGLRDYGHAGQLGAEPTPAEYIAALVECTREMVRVLEPSGSIFVNLGDKYGPNKSLRLLPERYRIACVDELGLIARAVLVWSKPNGLPESVTDRVRRSHEDWVHLTKSPGYFSAVDEIREPVAPSSQARAHLPRKVSPKDGIRKNGNPIGVSVEAPGTVTTSSYANPLGKLPGSVWEIATQPLRVPAELGVDHFAAFPMEWPRRLILGWSPRGVCDDCGFLLGSSHDKGMLGVRSGDSRQGSRRSAASVLLEGVREPEHGTQQGVHEVPTANDARLRGGVEAGSPDGAEERLPDGAPTGDVGAPGAPAGTQRGRASQERDQDGQPDRELGATGEARPRSPAQARTEAVRVPALQRHDPNVRDALSCPHCGGGQVRPSLIVDPFGGTGTTALVAAMHGRHGISVDASADYCRLAQWRVNDPKQRERASRPAGRPVRVAAARPHHDAPAVGTAVLPEGAEAPRAEDVLGEQPVDGRGVPALAVGELGSLELGVSGEADLRHGDIVQPAGQCSQALDVA
jgi:DNA modification methylase